MSWTDERIATLKKMWEGGSTASQIADELGGVSRNAVIGKAHRLGLKSRPSPVKANEKKKTAKKKTTTKKKATRKKSAAPVSKERDKVTTRSIELLADGIARTGLKGKEPCVDIPLRTVTNMRWNKKKRILEMGDSTQTRNLFNVGQAKKFMQTLLLAKGSRELIKAEKTLSLRGMYYMSLHTIEGTKEKTFNEQSESDNILEDLEVSLGGLREELHVFAKKRGTMVGNITVIDSGDEINCRKMGTHGQLQITDNGSGFNPDQLLRDDQRHFGLSIMAARAERINGKLRIDSAPGRGTHLVVDWPLAVAHEVE